MKTKQSLGCLVLACFISGCDNKSAPPPTAAQPIPSTQPGTQPAQQTSATPPPAPEVAVSAQKPMPPAEAVDLGSLMNRICNVAYFYRDACLSVTTRDRPVLSVKFARHNALAFGVGGGWPNHTRRD